MLDVCALHWIFHYYYYYNCVRCSLYNYMRGSLDRDYHSVFLFSVYHHHLHHLPLLLVLLFCLFLLLSLPVPLLFLLSVLWTWSAEPDGSLAVWLKRTVHEPDLKRAVCQCDRTVETARRVGFNLFWKQFGHFIVRSLNGGFEKSEWSATQKEGLIVCIPKGNKPKE